MTDACVAAKAEPELTSCVQSRTAPVSAFLALAGIYQSRRDDQALLGLALAATRRFPQDERFYLTAGALAGRKGDYHTSIEVLTRGLQRWPDHAKMRALAASAYALRGAGLLDKGEHAKAAEDLGHAVRLQPRDTEAWLNLGRAQQNLKRFGDALESFSHVASAPLLHFHRGLALYSLGRFPEAVAELKSEQEYPPAAMIRGLAQLASGETEAAVADLRAAVSKMPDSSQAYAGLGRALLRAGQVEAAEKHLREAVRMEPRDAALLNTLVSALVRLGKREEARALSERAAQLAAEQR